MARTARRLVAGIVVAGSLAAIAPHASASGYCTDVEIRGRYYRVCF